MSTKLIHEEMRGGVRVRLTVLEHDMVAEALRGNEVIAKTIGGHGGAIGPNSFKPQTSPFARQLMNEVGDKASGILRKSNFDLLLDDLHSAKKRAGGGLCKALGKVRRVVLLAKAQRDLEPAPSRAAGLASRGRQHAEASYRPNEPINDAVLRRVLSAARSGRLTPDDVQAVQQARRDGRALPSHVLRKMVG
ncbi:hypothetical protein ACNHE5_19395 [Pandoraea pnomenusa]|uniref:hypothetical protein n=1 Tax=Pandoraea pnomenusa TaxID=93220 RepID=UPI003CEB20A8